MKFELSPEAWHCLQHISDSCNGYQHSELLSQAIGLLDLIVKEKILGKRIFFEKDGIVVSELELNIEI